MSSDGVWANLYALEAKTSRSRSLQMERSSALGKEEQENEKDRKLQEIIKEVVGIHVLVTHSLFASDIPHRFLLRVSPAKSTSAAWPY